MTEHKFTDEEIIKAFEVCAVAGYPHCNECPLRNKSIICRDVLFERVFRIINRQKAEIKSLEDTLLGELSASAAAIIEDADGKCKEVERSIKAEAVKEFADRLKKKLIEGGIYPVLVKNSMDKLLKEMTGEKE
jgi:hypothetical protein